MRHRDPVLRIDHSHRELADHAQTRYHCNMPNTDRIARLRIELDGIDPKVWRVVEVPLTTTLTGLHKVIQAAMLFDDVHLFQFDVGDARYAIPDPEWEDVRKTVDAGSVTLGTLIDLGVGSFSYTYDFGDNWQHAVTIETVATADPAVDYPRFIDGRRRAPPEDVGGIPGFEQFLDAMANPRHPERKALLRWYGRPFDPDDIDLPGITARTGKIARGLAHAKAPKAKTRGSLH